MLNVFVGVDLETMYLDHTIATSNRFCGALHVPDQSGHLRSPFFGPKLPKKTSAPTKMQFFFLSYTSV